MTDALSLDVPPDSPLKTPLDHLVYATPDLERTVAEVAERTGVRPVEGGRHPGRGTRNYLLGLGGRRYFEIVGPDPKQPEVEGARWFGVDSLTAPRLAHWAVRTGDLGALVARARAGGYDPGEPVAMSRRAPDGSVLAWRLTLPQPTGRDGLLPFLLDWGTTTHPADRGLPEVPLVSFEAGYPAPERVRRELAALGATLDVRPATEPSLTAVVRGRWGPVVFGPGGAP